MIVIRNTFHLKFGKAREATALMKEAVAAQKKAGFNAPTRLLADRTGTFYTLVLEITMPDLATLESEMPRVMALPDFQAAYQKFSEFVNSGTREIFTVVE
jgi:hypothetical protein